ncbi:hypothetical protein DV735_g4044, partial [Chaetothyriales sp. CBS 134920]
MQRARAAAMQPLAHHGLGQPFELVGEQDGLTIQVEYLNYEYCDIQHLDWSLDEALEHPDKMAASDYYTALVLYPADAKFNLEYYTKTHMPFAAAEFKEFGFKGYTVTTNLATPDPSVASPHSVVATLFFEKPDGLANALKAKGAKILGDVPNFSDKGPSIIGGTTVVSTLSL